MTLLLAPAIVGGRHDGRRSFAGGEFMIQMKHQWSAGALAIAGALVWSGLTAHADLRDDDQDNGGRRTVFVVAMENHNWTQPATTTNPQPVFMNPDAPFINGLVNGTSGISDQVAYATNYINAGVGVHPSEPNYVWVEAGSALNSLGTDADPY